MGALPSTPHPAGEEVGHPESGRGRFLHVARSRRADFPFGACYGVGTLACHQGAVVDTTYGEAVTAPTSPSPRPPGRPDLRRRPEGLPGLRRPQGAVTEPPPTPSSWGPARPAPCRCSASRTTLRHPVPSRARRRLPRPPARLLPGHGYCRRRNPAELQGRVRLDDVSDSWKAPGQLRGCPRSRLTDAPSALCPSSPSAGGGACGAGGVNAGRTGRTV